MKDTSIWPVVKAFHISVLREFILNPWRVLLIPYMGAHYEYHSTLVNLMSSDILYGLGTSLGFSRFSYSYSEM